MIIKELTYEQADTMFCNNPDGIELYVWNNTNKNKAVKLKIKNIYYNRSYKGLQFYDESHPTFVTQLGEFEHAGILSENNRIFDK